MASGFEVGVCVDLGAFHPHEQDYGGRRYLENAGRTPHWVCLMEDRAPTFYHTFSTYQPDAAVPLNRHGPNPHAWTQRDLKGLVETLQAEGVAVLLGYWIHECGWVDDRQPQLLMRQADGAVWGDRVKQNADFNPMKRLRADPVQGIPAGKPYMEWATEQYRRLQAAFGFDGLFLGDGGMGFRHHGHDEKGLTVFDYSPEWVQAFRESAHHVPHEGCALGREDAPAAEWAEDVRAHHWAAWVDWNTAEWTGFYAHMAREVHATGGKLAAYNVMNFDPALALVHGVDYRGIAEAGLDYLVFQTYDFAWGDLGPFGFLAMKKKDLQTNLEALLATRAHVGHDIPMKILFTAETNDSVEHWDSPMPHTLGEAYAYAGARSFTGRKWVPVVDGAFIVWGSDMPAEEWQWLARAFAEASAPRDPAGSLLVWDEEKDLRCLLDTIHGKVTPGDLYAHHEAFTRRGPVHAALGGVLRAEHVARLSAEKGDIRKRGVKPRGRAKAER
ncbi:MAG TPA: hypothetical protein VNZ52_01140 [Candidatus Thermoplasmatota archaeon]|nr:hypothetical protein [Candidatus Thermoplasmatota archaeon]